MILLGSLSKEEAARVEVGQAGMWPAPKVGHESKELARPLRLGPLKPLASVHRTSRRTTAGPVALRATSC